MSRRGGWVLPNPALARAVGRYRRWTCIGACSFVLILGATEIARRADARFGRSGIPDAVTLIVCVAYSYAVPLWLYLGHRIRASIANEASRANRKARSVPLWSTRRLRRWLGEE
ncbi:hypothetical protein [Frondihabitans australicus]|uniref:hypothetical protein n=1 Tax=Frondihabitans australicus TaxID=386892 RepID=UPI000EAE710D|nr:hypothetical protein [Frondihabitans australicus]